MPFLLGHPQLLFLEALHEVPAIVIRNIAKINIIFRLFIGSELKNIKETISKINYFPTNGQQAPEYWKKINKIRKYTVLNTQNPIKLLIAPLNWGLGHTTRCIPLIRYLLQKNCQIWIAGNEEQLRLIKEEFPFLNFIQLTGYQIAYPTNRKLFAWKIFTQLPGLLKSISRENHWLANQQKKFHWDLVISDNRFGLYHTDLFTVFITHQLAIRSDINRLTDNLLRRFNYHFIRQFRQCWIPDNEGAQSLAGALSHPALLPANKKFIGPLSRFSFMHSEKTCGLLVSISGPEPQRSIFEQIVLVQVRQLKEKVIIVRGKPGIDSLPFISDNVTIYNHLAGNEMQKQIAGASIVLARSGYSTVMDLVVMKKKAILVPTPGQTEQEYLGDYLSANKSFYVVNQEQLNLYNDIKSAEAFPFSHSAFNFRQFESVIDHALAEIGETKKIQL